MPDKYVTILAVGDIVGLSGIQAVQSSLSDLKTQYHAQYVVANVENSSDGFGVDPAGLDLLRSAGVDIFTTGNHAWDDAEGMKLFEECGDLLRPANFPQKCPGKGWVKVDICGIPFVILHVMGRINIQWALDCPFHKTQEILQGIEDNSVVLVEFHAESAEEKQAFFHFFTGKITAMWGTHTHVQTRDARISQGAAYITDIGASCVQDSVIGFSIDTTLSMYQGQFKQRDPHSLRTAEGPSVVRGVAITIDTDTKQAVDISCFQH